MHRWYRRVALPGLSRFSLGWLAILLAALPSSGIVSASTPAPVTLPGHVLKNLPQLTRLGPVAPDQALTLTIALRPSSPSGLQSAAIHAQAAGPGAAQWLTPQAIGQAYGQPQSAINSLANYFAGYGLTAAPPRPDHLSFQV